MYNLYKSSDSVVTKAHCLENTQRNWSQSSTRATDRDGYSLFKRSYATQYYSKRMKKSTLI